MEPACGGARIDGAALGIGGLSILDLSDRASQPMVSEDGRLVVVFNGEIYNYPTLRKELEADGVRFRTTSDTEVLLAPLRAPRRRDGASTCAVCSPSPFGTTTRRGSLPCARPLRHQAALHRE